jgi:hypothetical protein
MYYSVQIKRNPRNPFDIETDYTFVEAYFQGCDKHYLTEQQAIAYFHSFEDWEQDLLEIDSFPF